MNNPAGRAFVLFLSLLAASMTFDRAHARAVEVARAVEAVWQPQKLSFHFRADGVMFSCSSLRQKVERILLKVGARAQAMVRDIDCGELSRIVRIDILLESPVEATEENVRRITQFDSREHLVARVRGVRLPTAADIERFPAVWQEVSLGWDSRIGLGRGDCALLEQLRTYVLPRLSVQIIKDVPHCVTGFVRGPAPRMRVMALVPATPADAVLTALPAEHR